MLFALGYGLQDVLTPKGAEAPVYKKDGIIYRPDMSFQPAPAEVEQLVEIKTTRKSAKYHFMDEHIPETWLAYMKGGCFMRDVDQYDLIVLYMMGNYCLGPETLVLKADLTWTEIKNLKVGDRLVGVDEYPTDTRRGTRRKLQQSVVTSIGVKRLPSRRLFLSNGRSVLSSDKHLWLEQKNLGNSHVAPDWAQTSSLVVGDKIRQLCEPWEVEDTYEAGWLAGALDGEGTVDGLRAAFSQKDNIVALQARRILDSLNIYTVPCGTNSGVTSYRTTDMASTLRLLGSIRPVRLLQDLKWEGRALPQHNSTVFIDAIEDVGEVDLIAIGTSTKTLIAEGLVSHNSPPFPEVYCDTFVFEYKELVENWDIIQTNKRVLDESVATGKAPEPFKHCYDWECKYCRYQLVCKTITQGLGVTDKQLEEDMKLWQ